MEERPCAVLLKFPGTNCDAETARALEEVGFVTETLPVSALEAWEILEQLRLIEAGSALLTYVVAADCFSVDTPEQLEQA
ncbi:MAG: phosphoribosylformylglycinamidine synthase subunit PurQ, partial [Verrucomicrobiales bacterium]|nr:phosphoribosylformylglycinamidine synthase subunit PurQ [Verrucomicrobiales bacterium]